MSVDKFGRYDHVGKKLSTDLSDVANMVFVKNNCLLLSATNNCYDAKNRCIRNVNLPSLPNDAANMQYVQNYTLGRTTGMHYTAKNKCIKDLCDPVLPSDAATMSFVNKVSLKRTHPDENIDLEGKLIRNLGNPLLPSDAVSLEYLSTNTPKMSNTHWMFSNKKLSNVQDPSYEDEAVNLRTLTKYLTKYVTNHEAQLERLSSAIFDYIHRSSGRSVESGITNKNYLNMDAILNRKLTEEEGAIINKVLEEEEVTEQPLRREKGSLRAFLN